MNSDQERALFEQYGWTHDYVGRKWVSPDGTREISADAVVRLTEEPEGDMVLMRYIVEGGRRDARRGG